MDPVALSHGTDTRTPVVPTQPQKQRQRRREEAEEENAAGSASFQAQERCDLSVNEGRVCRATYETTYDTTLQGNI